MTGSAGGFTVPEGFYTRIVEAMKSFGGIRGAGLTVVRTDSGNDIPVPQSDDTANAGALIAENTEATEQDIAFTQALFKAYTFTSKIVRVPNQLLQDSGFDMDRFVTRTLARRIARAEATYFVTGTGTNEPEGILTNVATGHTAAATTDITYGELVELQYLVDPRYRAVGEWADLGRRREGPRRETDADGKPLYPELANGVLLGRPVTVDVGLPAVAATNTPIVFGDLSGFAIRDVASLVVTRLSERYAEYNQTGFILCYRTDSWKIASDSPYKALAMAAV
ncbi:MAG TPA: phage major capsid protein [Acidimicrobiia bacterium]|nr:phage major capsid protein [Acidimicrobiia bacterium]